MSICQSCPTRSFNDCSSAATLAAASIVLTSMFIPNFSLTSLLVFSRISSIASPALLTVSAITREMACFCDSVRLLKSHPASVSFAFRLLTHLVASASISAKASFICEENLSGPSAPNKSAPNQPAPAPWKTCSKALLSHLFMDTRASSKAFMASVYLSWFSTSIFNCSACVRYLFSFFTMSAFAALNAAAKVFSPRAAASALSTLCACLTVSSVMLSLYFLTAFE